MNIFMLKINNFLYSDNNIGLNHILTYSRDYFQRSRNESFDNHLKDH